MTPSLGRKATAEAVGTGLLAAVVVGSGIFAQRLSPNDVGLQLLESSTATAGGLVALILAFGSISGAHFNPVVTLADRVFGGMTTAEALRSGGRPGGGRGAQLRGRAGRRRVWRRHGGQPHVRPPGGEPVDAHAVVGGPLAG